MKNTWKLLSLVVCFMLISLMVVACGQQNKTGDELDSNEASENKGTKEEDDTSKEDVTLSVFHFRLEADRETDPRCKAFWTMVDKFREDNPNITLEFEEMATDPYSDKIQTLAAANQMPDFFQIKSLWDKGWVENGLLLPLDDILASDPEWRDSIGEGAYMQFIVDDKIYGLSAELGGRTCFIFYNSEILKECGINQFPEDMDGFYTAIESLKENDYTPIALGNKGKWVAQSCILSTLGAMHTGEQWNQSIANYDGAKFTDEAFVNALTELQKWADLGAFNSDLNSIDHNQQKTLYYNKDAVMFFEGDWAVSSIVNDAPKDVSDATKIASIPFAEGGNGEPNMSAGGYATFGLGLSSALKDEPAKLEAAEKLLHYIVNPESSKILAEGGLIPAIQVEYDMSDFHPLKVDALDFMAEAVNCTVYDSLFDPAVIEVMNSGLQELLIGAVTPEDLAQRLQTEYEFTQE